MYCHIWITKKTPHCGFCSHFSAPPASTYLAPAHLHHCKDYSSRSESLRVSHSCPGCRGSAKAKKTQQLGRCFNRLCPVSLDHFFGVVSIPFFDGGLTWPEEVQSLALPDSSRYSSWVCQGSRTCLGAPEPPDFLIGPWQVSQAVHDPKQLMILGLPPSVQVRTFRFGIRKPIPQPSHQTIRPKPRCLSSNSETAEGSPKKRFCSGVDAILKEWLNGQDWESKNGTTNDHRSNVQW